VHLYEGLQLRGYQTLEVQPIGGDGAGSQALEAGVGILMGVQPIGQESCKVKMLY